MAEVENLFLVEELLYIINDILGFNDDDKVKNVKDYIIKDRFAKEIDKQICEAIVSEIKFKLTIANISTKNEEEAKDSLESAFKSISYDELKAKYTGEFNEILELEAYSNVLKVFNSKSLSTSIGHFFGIDNKGYRELIVRHIKGNRVDEIIRAISPYLPEEIPIEINIK